MNDLEDKYLTSENMWILNLPSWLEKPVFRAVHFLCKIKYTFEYAKHIWKTNDCFDLDGMGLVDLLEFKLERMQKQMTYLGNIKASKQIEQALLYCHQYFGAEDYVSLPAKFAGKLAEDLFDISLDSSNNLQLSTKMSKEDNKEYAQYLADLTSYAGESWNLFWKQLKDHVAEWE